MYDLRSSVVVVGGTAPVSVSCACNCVGFSVYARYGASFIEDCSVYSDLDFFF
jgi:hypothetical protein